MPSDVARHLVGLEVPWAIAGGWALELHDARLARPHEDLEIAIPADSWPAVRAALSDLAFDLPVPGWRWPLGRTTTTRDLAELAKNYQTWGRNGDGSYVIDVFREPHDGDTWTCRRDESIRLPYSEVISVGGVAAYVNPQIVLLFKAKNHRPKDEADFDATLPLLTDEAREWLAWALRRCHPDHAWLGRLHESH